MSSNSSIGANHRFLAVKEVQNRVPRKFDPPRDESGKRLKISEFFGQNTFDMQKLKEKLPKDVYKKLLSTIQTGSRLEVEVANVVAQAVKEWAMTKGVTHYTHWFQPQTGLTAEKHDAFITTEDNGKVLEKFSGSQLVQSEPDASSFPSGGMRTTFEARGYAAWDPSSPMFIMDGPGSKTLCIPSVFISYHGDALDEKTGLLRSIDALSKKATELLHLLGEKDVLRVLPTLGVEQEYFLIDRSFYTLRPDLLMSGRTLLGGQAPKGQQLEDHYFGSIPSRVLACMSEMEHELFKLGVPIKTRHNEVAPSQFETAPIFEEANIATDHNQIVMEILKRVANRHGFQALLHEKPFAGINGSGKHNNWSMMIESNNTELHGENLLEPGKTPHENLRFLLVVAAILKGVYKHSGVLRASIASSGNDHRLGANEAPPAIISIFLGELLTKIMNDIEAGTVMGSSAEKAVLSLGVNKLPEVLKDSTDRNRTSPFAFTGNKFEFRAVGSSANTAFPCTVLNAAIADGIEMVTEMLKAKGIKGGTDNAKIFEVLRDIVKETKAIRFEGNGYSEEWVTEAQKRGLLNLRKSPEALHELTTKASVELFSKLHIFSEAEIQSRFHVRVERYIKNMQIEVDCLKQIIDTQILPAAYMYHGTLARAAADAKAAGVKAPQTGTLNKLTELLETLNAKRGTLTDSASKAEALHDEYKKAEMYSQSVATVMMEVRDVCDEIESITADDFWPLPKYREMLFIS
ncbi:MAG: glutamine synthetase III family protein [Bdellovibrio sp.]